MAERSKGKVYLVGAGPGDPGLLTVKAKECIERADVVVYDYLANRIFLDFATPDAELIYVGKQGDRHTMVQEDINNLTVDKARQGLTVVRLKGGDPFIFGRGGEEAQQLAGAGVFFEVIPGITSAIAVPAYAGIPLTHRDFTSTVTLVTGHEDPTKERSEINWGGLAAGSGTLVFLMGIKNLDRIAANLIKHGRSPTTPAAVIHRGTVPSQITVTGTLDTIAALAVREGIRPPSVIVVGDVVTLRERLNWFERKPLFGKRIIVTRARDQASGFMARLIELGAECIEFPTIEIIPPGSWDGLDRAIGSLDTYQWILFTSVNGVRYFFNRLEDLEKDSRDLKGISVGAIGPKTADAIRERGIRPDLIPDEYRAEAVVAAFQKYEAGNLRILLPRAARAREILPGDLRKMGARVDVVEAYRTITPGHNREEIRGMLKKGHVHMITFTSSSTVTNFMGMFEKEDRQVLKWMETVSVACIGPITGDTAEKHGLKVALVSGEYTVEALTNSIVRYFSENPRPLQ